MRKFELTILGSNSAMPAYGRWPTCQILALDNELIMIDCGEGAQIRMSQYKIKRSKINHVLISHLHGDHIYGLPGFIGSLAHLSRKEPLRIYGPKGIKEYIDTVLRLSESHLSFSVEITEIHDDGLCEIISNNRFSIKAFPVSHRITTLGYMITEAKEEKNVISSAIKEYGLSIEEIKAAKAGHDIRRGKEEIPNALLTKEQAPSRSYAYCADTKAEGWDKVHLKGVDLLYLETTYLDELSSIAAERGHMTARQAGSLARALEAKQLVIGHYSSRYKSIEPLIHEASLEFLATRGGMDGTIIQL